MNYHFLPVVNWKTFVYYVSCIGLKSHCEVEYFGKNKYLRYSSDEHMKYTGRMTVSIFVFVMSIFWHFKLHTLDYLQFSFTIGYCIFAWFLGKQFDKAKFYSEKDALTEIYNRRFVLEIFPKLMSNSNKNNEKIGLAILDVNEFKKINDQYGHEMGDKVLKLISDALLNNTRKTDVIARWGGDEFIIIAPFTDCLEIIIKRLENELEQISVTLNFELSVSIGSAIYPTDAQKLNDLIRVADKNMYKSKPNNVKS